MSEVPPAGGARLEKREVRRQVLAARRALSGAEREARSRMCLERLMREPRFAMAHCVCAYAPLPYELDVSDIYEHLWTQGKTLALPRIAEATGELHLHRYEAGDELIVSDYSVREPRPDAPLVADDEVELVLVPGVAFDRRGYRLGYGKGYYDRLLPRLGKAMRIGVGFALQRLDDELAHDEWDVSMHRFVSEAESLEFGEPDLLLP